MATRKQRSKRAKTFRHDYALVVDDEEGNEVEISAAEARAKKQADAGPTCEGAGEDGARGGRAKLAHVPSRRRGTARSRRACRGAWSPASSSRSCCTARRSSASSTR